MKRLLTLQHHFQGEGPHIPFCHNQLHNGEQCSYSYPKHPLLLQPRGELEHILPEMIKEHVSQVLERT